ncbi:MAG: OmpA/MotB family protein [Opitutaceae bacterium]
MAGGGGGAWKVAYADFVTAMMALFMVLWISAQDQEILIATSKYFQSPFNSPMDASSGVMSSESGGGSGESAASEETATSMADMSFLNQLAREFYKLLEIEDSSSDAPVEVRVTNDGLRITVFDRTEQPLFQAGSDEFTEWGRFVVQNLAWVLDRYDFRVRIDGHTATGYQATSTDYTAWELSADRANATRRALQFYAVPAKKIERVTGFAGTVPLPGTKPEDDANQRIELSMVIAEPLRASH